MWQQELHTVGSSGSVSFSVGQVTYTSDSTSAGSVSAGVQQAYVVEVIDGIENETVQLGFIAYPNPTNGTLWLKYVEDISEEVNYTLLDISGKLLQSGNVLEQSTEINMHDLPSGSYQLLVTSSQTLIKSFKILKIQ